MNDTITITLNGELDVRRALIPMLASLHRRIVRTWAGDGTGQTVLRLAPAV